MLSKQDRITDAMKERIAQLEAELTHCKHHLSETVQQKESLECDIEALQNEAHDVVAQWVAKSSELQTKFDECVSQNETLQNDLLLSTKKNEELQHRLKDADATNSVQTEELHRLRKIHEDLTEKLSVMETDFFSLSQRIIHYENLVSKMDLDMKHNMEETKSVLKERDMLIETATEIREEKRRSEADYFEARTFIGLLQEDVANCQQSLIQLSDIITLAEAERNARDEIFLNWGTHYLEILQGEIRGYIQDNAVLQVKHREQKEEISALQKEKFLLETRAQNSSDELIRLRQEYDKTENYFSQQVRLLEQDIAELQDSQIGQKQIVDSLQKELESSISKNQLLESQKEELNTEFKAVKDCYSLLLVEYNEIRISEQRRQEEANAKIELLTGENRIIRTDCETRLQDLMRETVNLRELLLFAKREALELTERESRLTMEASQYKEYVTLFSHYNAHLIAWSKGSYEQFLNIMKEMSLKDDILKEAGEKNHVLCENLDTLEKEISLKQQDIAQLEFKVLQLSSELKSSKATQEEIANDNIWLKDQVESMRRELGELDELLNSNLNDMREDSERQQLEREKLIQETRRYESLLRQSQEKMNSLDERYIALVADNDAISKTLLLTESALLNAKKDIKVASQREKLLVEEKREIEAQLLQLQKKNLTVDSQTAFLQEQVQTQEAKLQLLSSSSRQEMETLKIKLNTFIEKYEDAEARVRILLKSIQDSENIQSSLREAYQKAKSALEEAKQRCCKDTETIQKLLEERQDLENERKVVVEKYNRVHDMLKTLKKDNMGKFADELQNLSDLCFQQEVELQQLRHQNILLKKGIKKLPISANNSNQIERPVFVERLNLTEGPLRRPKKRPSLN